MIYRTLLALLVFCWIAPVHAAAPAKSEAPKAEKYKIYMILYRGMTDAEKGFLFHLKNRNIPVDIVTRDCNKDVSKVSEYITEIRSMKPDLIYAFGTSVAAKLVGLEGKVNPREHITDIPVIFNIVADPVGAKLVSNLKSSGRNLTGATHLVPLEGQFKGFKTVMDFKRLGFVYTPNEKNAVLILEKVKELSKGMGFEVLPAPITPDADGKIAESAVEPIMKQLVQKKADAVFFPSDSSIISNIQSLAKVTMDHRLPSFSATEEPVRKAGVMMGVVNSYFNVGQLAGYKAEQILVKKIKPQDVPIETLNRSTFLIDMKTAKSFDIYPPVMVLKFAEVISQ
ncbi:MAG: hypothetical protein H6R18_1508 [Proteobacteria bacterium]|nr:hypothetical protein [Pseudomonadota bacterium]